MRPGFEEEESVDEGIIKIEYDIESFFYLHTMLVFKVKIESLFYTRKCEFACVYVCIVC